jgi:protein SCO1
VARPAAAVVAALLLAVAPAVAADMPALPFGGPFELVDHTGAVRRDTDFRGRFLLVYFGYTRCPDLCPLGLDAIVGALGLLGPEAGRVQPLFVTVDPADDTPKVLRRYLADFDPRLLGLTGSEAQIRAAAKAYKVHRRLVTPAGGGEPLIDHGSLTYLVGPDGGFLTLFPHGTTAERMAEVVGGYLAAGRRPSPQ